MTSSKSDLEAFFEASGKRVLTFVGYSDAGYQDPALMLERAQAILEEHDPETTLVNSGATPSGIGAIYPLAKRLGFATTGIVSSLAREAGVAVSPFVDRVFFIPDETWGGFLDDGVHLSPTSRTMIERTDVLVGIGGGAVARDELIAAKRAGKDVRFFPADMDHARAIRSARQDGLTPPEDFRGAADRAPAPDGPESPGRGAAGPAEPT